MADNTLQTAAETISTDEIATLNGVTQAAGLKMQRMKMAFGSDSVARDIDNANPLPVGSQVPVYRGRAGSFRIPGRAGTTGQKLISLHNATGSTVKVTVNKVFVDLLQTAVIAVTVIPPIVRVYLVTVLPTNGTACTKVALGGTGATSANVTALQDASADGTNSTTALTATLPAGAVLTQEFAPRLITAAGYEVEDRMEFFNGDATVSLGALQGIVVMLDYTVATANPITNFWIAGIDWSEN